MTVPSVVGVVHLSKDHGDEEKWLGRRVVTEVRTFVAAEEEDGRDEDKPSLIGRIEEG